MATTNVTMLPLHENDIILLEKILSTEVLVLATISFATVVIRLYASGRYHAIVDVDGITHQFRLKELQDNSHELVSTYRNTDVQLTELVWHKAAEAMLAHRRGHRDAYLRKELRKPKQKQDD